MQQLFGGPRLLLQLSFLQPQAKGGKWLGGAFWGEAEAEEEQPCTVWRGAGEKKQGRGNSKCQKREVYLHFFSVFFFHSRLCKQLPQGGSPSLPLPCKEMKVGSYKGSSSVAVIVLPGGGKEWDSSSSSKSQAARGRIVTIPPSRDFVSATAEEAFFPPSRTFFTSPK